MSLNGRSDDVLGSRLKARRRGPNGEAAPEAKGDEGDVPVPVKGDGGTGIGPLAAMGGKPGVLGIMPGWKLVKPGVPG